MSYSIFLFTIIFISQKEIVKFMKFGKIIKYFDSKPENKASIDVYLELHPF